MIQSITCNYIKSVESDVLIRLENTLFEHICHIQKIVQKALQLPDKFDFDYFDAMDQKLVKTIQSHRMISSELETRFCPKNIDDIMFQIYA